MRAALLALALAAAGPTAPAAAQAGGIDACRSWDREVRRLECYEAYAPANHACRALPPNQRLGCFDGRASPAAAAPAPAASAPAARPTAPRPEAVPWRNEMLGVPLASVPRPVSPPLRPFSSNVLEQIFQPLSIFKLHESYINSTGGESATYTVLDGALWVTLHVRNKSLLMAHVGIADVPDVQAQARLIQAFINVVDAFLPPPVRFDVAAMERLATIAVNDQRRRAVETIGGVKIVLMRDLLLGGIVARIQVAG